MFTRPAIRSSLVTMLLALLPGVAAAHPGHDAASSLLAGLMHPLTGLDHVLMIVAVSAWAALETARRRVAIASSLALFVGLGALLPVNGGAVLEAAIALTLVGAGLLLATARRLPLPATASIASLFALLHGFAHGAEGPASSLLYVAGLMLATASLALLVSSLVAGPLARPVWRRVGGLFSAAAGIAGLTV